MPLGGQKLPVSLIGLATAAWIANLVIESTYRPLSLGVPEGAAGQASADFVVATPGRYTLNLTCDASRLPKPLLDELTVPQNSRQISCDLTASIERGSKPVFDTKVLSLRASSQRDKTLAFRIGDWRASVIGTYRCRLRVDAPADVLSSADPKLELELSAPIRQYRMIVALLVKIAALCTAATGAVLLLRNALRCLRLRRGEALVGNQ